MGAVLVASLGKSPGVITTLVDALREKEEDIEKVIPVYVKDTTRSSREPLEIRELIKEFSDRGRYNGEIIFDYENSWLEGKDIGEEEEYVSLGDFYRETLKVIRNQSQEVIIGIGGGRKGMSSIMTYAAITLEIKKIYQVIVSEEVEEIGKPGVYKAQKKREQALHPKPNQYWLVKLPSSKRIREIRRKIRQEGNEAIDSIRVDEHPTI